MNRSVQVLALVGLCLAAIAAGEALGRRDPQLFSTSQLPTAGQPAAPANAPILPGATATIPEGTDRERAIARSVARCDTTQLWKYLATQPENGTPFSNAIFRELYDRLGPERAIMGCLNLEDRARCNSLAEGFLYLAATRDPLKALDLYQAHRSELGDDWARYPSCQVIQDGCKSSADAVIAGLSRGTQDNAVQISPGEFAPGFDFRKLADYLTGVTAEPALILSNVREEWSRRSPVHAAAWIMQHPSIPLTDHDEGDQGNAAAIAAMATTDAAGGKEAIALLTALPGQTRANCWEILGNQTPTFDPRLLEAATTMGQRDTYLVPALNKTRADEALPAAWAAVPPAERPALLDAVEAQWVGKDTPATPVDLKARAHWRASLERQWDALPGK